MVAGTNTPQIPVMLRVLIVVLASTAGQPKAVDMAPPEADIPDSDIPDAMYLLQNQVALTNHGNMMHNAAQKVEPNNTVYQPVLIHEELDQQKKGLGNGPGRNTAPRIRFFFHIFKGEDQMLAINIVNEQMLDLQRLSLNSFEVDFTTVGTPWDVASINASGLNCSTCSHRAHYHEGWEPVTLQPLYEYCIQHPTRHVAYMHDKGSFHDQYGKNDDMRRFMMKGITSDECVNMPATCNVCSSRFTPLPHPHSPGNMWHAKCSHIRTLKPPASFEQTMDDFWAAHKFACPWPLRSLTVGQFAGMAGHLHGTGRYSAEHWVHSAPGTEPCDLYAGSYIQGYELDANARAGTWLPQLQIGMRWPLRRYGSVEFPLDPRDVRLWVQWRCLEWRVLYKKLPSNFSTWRFEESLQTLAGVSLETVDSCTQTPSSPGDGPTS